MSVKYLLCYMESGREIVRVVICKTFTIPLISVPAHDLMAVPKFRAFHRMSVLQCEDLFWFGCLSAISVCLT
jgi:hypothetical protein